MKRALAIATLAAIAVGPRLAYATGGCDPMPLEQLDHRPDDLPAFAAGKLGVVRPGFPRMFLAPAYLVLNGGALDKLEQKAVVEFWAHRILMSHYTWSSIAGWTTARASVPGVRKLANDEPPYGGACLEETFSDAIGTLARLSAAGGLSPAERKDWVGAQDLVFASCAVGKKPQIPPALPESATPLARAERRYQIASAHLYVRAFPQAIKAYAALASDKGSAWAPWSGYLVARAKLREALNAPAGGEDALPAIRGLFARVASGTGPLEVRRAALALEGYLEAKADGKAHLARVMTLVRKGGVDYADALGDWVVALDAMLDQATAADVPMPAATPDELAPLRERDDLVDWVLSFGQAAADAELRADGDREKFPAKDSAAYTHAYARWRATHSAAWLMAALANASPANAHLNVLLAAADQVPASAPARDSIVYYTLPLLHLAPGATRARLEREIAARAGHRRSSFLNWLSDRRLKLATSPEDAMRWSTRAILGDECGDTLEALRVPEGGSEHAILSRSATAFERAIEHSLPLAGLLRLRENAVSSLLGRRVLAMAWARALVLGAKDPEAAKQVDALLPALRREDWLEKSVPSALDALATASAEDRPLQAGLALLATVNLADMGHLSGRLSCPGAKPEEGAQPPDEELSDDAYFDANTAHALEALFAAPDRAARRAEIATLKPLGSDFDVAVAWIIAWANAHPLDARLPRIFYDINQKSRRLYGACHTSRSSKAAFQVMHKLFPDDPLTKKTRYWY